MYSGVFIAVVVFEYALRSSEKAVAVQRIDGQIRLGNGTRISDYDGEVGTLPSRRRAGDTRRGVRRRVTLRQRTAESVAESAEMEFCLSYIYGVPLCITNPSNVKCP